MIALEIPLRTVSALNAREHWATRARRVKKERAVVGQHLLVLLSKRVTQLPKFPVQVTLTRVGPRKMDFDNAISGLKGVRDELASFLGVDDGSDLVEWVYRQAKGPYSVLVRIEERP